MQHSTVRTIARTAVGLAAVVAQVGVAIFYIGWSLFVVPRDVTIGLVVLLLAGAVAVVWLAIRHPWLAPLVPIASAATFSLIYEYGQANLGWGG